jgi:3',5'-cyclic AMP phosphodiesterase CpdA
MKGIVKLFSVLILILLLENNSVFTQEIYQPPALSHPDSWTMILIPDPQSYMKFGRNQPLFELMTAWIAENIETLNIGFVMCVGDLVEQNDMVVPDGINGNLPSKAQWEGISRAFEKLDNKVPYILATGNHDYGFKNAEDRRTFFDDYFKHDRNLLTQKMLRHVGNNAFDRPTLENAAYEFISPHGQKFLILSLEFAPRDEIVRWAGDLINLPDYRQHRGILMTHAYMNHQGVRHERQNYPLKNVNYGVALWEKLIEPSKNIDMVFAGHIADNPEFRGGVAFRTDNNSGSRKVNQMVFNTQRLGGGWHGNGGDGWIRILEFLPDGRTVKVKTFSPLFAISPTTQKYAWSRELYNEFTFDLTAF